MERRQLLRQTDEGKDRRCRLRARRDRRRQTSLQDRRDADLWHGLFERCHVAAPHCLRCPRYVCGHCPGFRWPDRSEEHTSELQSLMRISYAVFCLKKKTSSIISISLILILHT